MFDAVLPEWGIAIEYDGGYWHDEPEVVERDHRKNILAKARGYTLIRLRLGMEALGPYDVLVGSRPDVDQWVELVRHQIMRVIDRILSRL